ncbi:hypothetical protein B0H12DRAFT_1077385 [Mycena haematopus]|nr:hypothetical protein B0H12DRAFT_1077385 [Mycena haematopus]
MTLDVDAPRRTHPHSFPGPPPPPPASLVSVSVFAFAFAFVYISITYMARAQTSLSAHLGLPTPYACIYIHSTASDMHTPSFVTSLHCRFFGYLVITNYGVHNWEKSELNRVVICGFGGRVSESSRLEMTRELDLDGNPWDGRLHFICLIRRECTNIFGNPFGKGCEGRGDDRLAANYGVYELEDGDKQGTVTVDSNIVTGETSTCLAWVLNVGSGSTGVVQEKPVHKGQIAPDLFRLAAAQASRSGVGQDELPIECPRYHWSGIGAEW